MATDKCIQAFAIGRRDILHIANVLQAPFNLERSGTCLGQLLQMVTLVEVFQRQQVTVMLDDASLGINQIKLHATELGTLASIGGAVEAMLRSIAEATIADAQGAMDKDLQLDVRHLTMDVGNLADRQFTGQDYAAEAQRAEPGYLLCRTVVCLSGGMKGQSWIHCQDSHVLNQNGINACISQVGQELASGRQLIVVENGVDGNVDLGLKLVGIETELANVGYAVACGSPRPKAVSPNVDCVCTVVNGRNSTLQIAGGG